MISTIPGIKVHPTRTFRVFFSSTFGDFRQERDAIREHVFPKIAALCRRHGARFSPVDLRWGITEEASREQSTMEACFNEIERCENLTRSPNFFLFLGDRYGAQPLPSAIPEADFVAIRDYVRQTGDKRQQRLLADWYGVNRDDNAIPPVYRLSPRPRGSDARAWDQVEPKLLQLLSTAAHALNFSLERGRPYGASATEQEIAHRGLLDEDAPHRWEGAFAFIRTIRNAPSGPEGSPWIDAIGSPANARVERLKRQIRRNLTAGVIDYDAVWTGSEIRTDLDQLCKQVRAQLENAILQQLEGEQTAVETLSNAHEAFAEDRLTSFVDRRTPVFIGREVTVKTIRDYIGNRESLSASVPPLVIIGAPGSGKTTMMAKVWQDVNEGITGGVIIPRFIGALPATTELIDLLRGLCREILERYSDVAAITTGSNPEEMHRDIHQIMRFFSEDCLPMASAEHPLILLVDGLDLLRHDAATSGFAWIPRSLPSHVRLVVSVASDTPALDHFLGSLEMSSVHKLPNMLDTEGDTLLSLWLAQAGRRLTDCQRRSVIAAFSEVGTPLFLRLVFERVRTWTSYAPASDTTIPNKTEDMIDALFLSLESPSKHGRNLVSRSLANIIAARDGLSWEEVLEVLSRDAEIMAPLWSDERWPVPVGGPLPAILWSKLHLDLAPYLAEQSVDGARTLSFYHRQLSDRARLRYASSSLQARHRHLATYFADQETEAPGIQAERSFNIRRLSELPFHLTFGALWQDLERLLTDLKFQQGKVTIFGVSRLIEDFDLALAESVENGGTAVDQLSVLRDGLVLSSHILETEPDQLPEQLLARLLTSQGPLVRRVLQQAEKREDFEGGWLRPERSSLIGPNGSLQRIFSADAAINALVATHDGGVLSGSADGWVRLWSIASGREVRRFKESDDEVNCLALLDGDRFVSGSRDGTLRLWEVDNPNSLWSVRAHEGWSGVVTLCVLPNGWLLSGGGDDYGIKLWDVTSPTLLGTLKGHEFVLRAFVPLADGRRVVSSAGDDTMRLWNIDTMAQIACFPAPQQGYLSLATLPDGRLVAGCDDGLVGVVDPETGKASIVLEGHTEPVRAVLVSKDGTRVFSAAGDHTVRTWDVAERREVRCLTGHVGGVSSLALLDDERLVSGSSDGKVRLWASQASTDETNFAFDSAVETIVVTSSHQAVTGHGDGSLRSIALPGGRQVAILRPAPLSGEEREEVTVAEPSEAQRPGSPPDTSPANETAANVPGLEDLQEKYGPALQFMQRNMAVGMQKMLDVMSTTEITCTLVLPDSRVLTGSQDGGVRLWELSGEGRSQVLGKHNNTVNTLVLLSADRALSGSNDWTFRIWDLERGMEVRKIERRTGAMQLQASYLLREGDILSVYGRMGFAGDDGGAAIVVWDLESGDDVKKFEDAPDGITSATLSADQSVLVCSTDQGTLRAWHLATGRAMHEWRSHRKAVTSVALSPGGKFLASASVDGSCRVWAYETREPVGRFAGDDEIRCLAFGSDDLLLAGSSQGAFHVLRIVPKLLTS